MKKILILVAAIAFSFSLTGYEPVSNANPANVEQGKQGNTEQPEIRDSTADLDTTIRNWIRVIAEQHKLSPWLDAEYEIQALGPGTHSWIVYVVEQQSPVGYMVINALQEGGYRLAEYGVGDTPLFALDTLLSSLIQYGFVPEQFTIEQLAQAVSDTSEERSLDIERYYLNPFAAYWKVDHRELKQTAFLDAKTGEQYPLDNNPADHAPANADDQKIVYRPTALKKLKATMQLPKFDPYHNLKWMVEKPLQISSLNQICELLDQKKRIVLTVELYDQTVMLPFPVVGYAEWSEAESYLLLHYEGLRYIPLIDVVHYGILHLQQSG